MIEADTWCPDVVTQVAPHRDRQLVQPTGA
jgi:hypothetical protein